jgi:hypothetical protein
MAWASNHFACYAGKTTSKVVPRYYIDSVEYFLGQMPNLTLEGFKWMNIDNQDIISN